MPDGDVISSGVRFSWRGAYEGMCGLADPAVIAPRIAKATSRMLRQVGGVPSLPAAVDIAICVSRGELDYNDSRYRAQSLGEGRIGMILRQAVSRAAGLQSGGLNTPEAFTLLFLREIVRVEVVSKAIPVIIAESNRDAVEASAYGNECLNAAEPDLKAIAKQLIETPAAGKYRAPPHRSPKKSTVDLLNEDLT